MLFDPITISGLKLKNRIVRSATYEKMADEDGNVTDTLIDLYTALAKGGSGLIITGFTLVHPSGRAIRKMLSIHSDLYVRGHKRLTDAVHAEGGLIALQLVHGGRQCSPILLGGEPTLAPSAIYDPSSKSTPKAMDDSEIWTMIDAFAHAAFRARTAGFDAVQLHGAHGYLISTFLSPHTNRRDDYWGGDEERRFHFAEEVIKAVRKEVGSEFPVLMKMNCDDLLPGGITPEEAVRIARKFEDEGIDAVEVSGGMRESAVRASKPDILRQEDEAYFREGSSLIKQRISIPVILTGGMRTLSVMQNVLSSGDADLIGLSRPLIREPDLPNLMKDGKQKADCISCNECTRFSRSRHVRCVFIEGEEAQENQ
jgi:2,4-dienoyl-CoA reductase-like NADH-dependent reductase (Old Yellow Enzyme family)